MDEIMVPTLGALIIALVIGTAHDFLTPPRYEKTQVQKENLIPWETQKRMHTDLSSIGLPKSTHCIFGYREEKKVSSLFESLWSKIPAPTENVRKSNIVVGYCLAEDKAYFNTEVRISISGEWPQKWDKNHSTVRNVIGIGGFENTDQTAFVEWRQRKFDEPYIITRLH